VREKKIDGQIDGEEGERKMSTDNHKNKGILRKTHTHTEKVTCFSQTLRNYG